MNEYTFSDSNAALTKILASDMQAALLFWSNNHEEEPASLYVSAHNLTVAADVNDPDVTVTNAVPAQGTVYPSASFTVAEGSEVIFTAVPETGYAFSKFTKTVGSTVTDITDNPAKIKITADTTVSVTWGAA